MSADAFDALRSYASKLPIDTPTPVFSRWLKKNVIEPEVRNSCSIELDHPDLLGMLDECFVKQFLAPLVVKCARLKVTFIRYLLGGSFDWHTDHPMYIINSSNRWVECHAVLCLNPATDGGELEIGDRKIVLKENMVVLFDKSLLHRGAVVKDGVKEIMTLDVLVSNLDSQQYRYLGMEAADCLKRDVTFMTPFNDPRVIDDLPKDSIVFEYLEIQWTDEGELQDINRFIIDSKGLYLHNKKMCRSCVNDTDDTDLYTLLSRVYSDIVGGITEFDRVIFKDHHRHIPRDKDPAKLFEAITIADDDIKESHHMGLSYYCNETNYVQVIIRHYVGVLVVPESLPPVEDLSEADRMIGLLDKQISEAVQKSVELHHQIQAQCAKSGDKEERKRLLDDMENYEKLRYKLEDDLDRLDVQYYGELTEPLPASEAIADKKVYQLLM